MKINRDLSAYLDCLRFMAALAVLFGHMEQDGLYMIWFPLARFSHEAVVVFFVMSGLIIYTTTVGSSRTPKEYIIARISRVYSVALPAIIFSIILYVIFQTEIISPEIELSNYQSPWLAFFSSIFFLNESWQNPVNLVLNGPYWSLCYEVWYYVLFGAFIYLDGKTRWVIFVIFSCLAGPAILALFPIWVAGAWLSKRIEYSVCWPNWLAGIIFVGSFIFIATINFTGIDIYIKEILHEHVPGFWRLKYSQRILTDYMIGIAVIVNIIAYTRTHPIFRARFFDYHNIFKFLAGFSFTLYLFHRPMTKLLGHYFPNDTQSIAYSIFIASIVISLCFIISYGTEHQLTNWRLLISKIIKV